MIRGFECLNCVTNSRMMKSEIFEEFYGDDGESDKWVGKVRRLMLCLKID
jgi:hypothetical protein